MGDRAGRECRRLSGCAVLPHHHRRHGTLAHRDSRRRAHALRAFTGAPEQLWRIDQLADGSYRIGPKSMPGITETLALSAVGSSMPTLSKFDPASDRQRWLLGAP